MVNSQQTKDESQDTKRVNENTPSGYRNLFVLCVIGAYVLLLVISIGWPNLSERTKFFTEFGLTLALLIVAITQARIYYSQQKIMRGQLEAMREHADIMTESVKENRRMAELNERAVIASEENVKVAKESFYLGELPYFGIKHMGIRHVGEGESPDVKITFVNGGKTPAWGFVVLVWIALGNDPESEDMHYLYETDSRIANRFIPAGGEQTATYLNEKYKVSRETSNALERATKPNLFVCGTAMYSDLRGKKHSYNFVTIYNPVSTTLDYWVKTEDHG